MTTSISDEAVLFGRDTSERYVIALCLQNVDNFIDVSSRLSSADFLFEQNRVIFEHISYVVNSGVSKIDLPSMVAALEGTGQLQKAGGIDTLSALFSVSADAVNLHVHVEQVLRGSVLSSLYNKLEKGRKFIKSNAKSTVGASEIIANIETSIMDASLQVMKVDDGKMVYDGIEDRLKELEENKGETTGLPSGFDILDSILDGFSPGGLYVVGARPKIGKSTLLSNWALNLCKNAVNKGKTRSILYIDTEMSFDEFQLRMVASLSGVPEGTIRRGELAYNPELKKQVLKAVKVLYKMPIIHKYMPGFTIEEVVSLVKKHKVRDNIDAFFFDYIKMVELNENFNETQTLGYLTMELKDLAGKLEIPVVTAVQLNREAAHKSRVGTQQVADSDRVLRYCNVLMALSRKTKEELEKEGVAHGTHRLQVLENRNGPSFEAGIDIEFTKPTLTMYEAPVQSPASVEERSSLGVVIG